MGTKLCLEGQKQKHETKPIENESMLFRQGYSAEEIQ